MSDFTPLAVADPEYAKALYAHLKAHQQAVYAENTMAVNKFWAPPATEDPSMPPKKKKPSPYDGYNFQKAVKMWSSEAGPTYEQLAEKLTIQQQYEQAMNQMATAKPYYGTSTWHTTTSPAWTTTVNTYTDSYLPSPTTAPDRSSLPEIRHFMQGMNKDTALSIVWGAIKSIPFPYKLPVHTPYGMATIEVSINSEARQFELYCLGELVATIDDLGFRINVIGPSEEEKQYLAQSEAWKNQKSEFERQLEEILA